LFWQILACLARKTKSVPWPTYYKNPVRSASPAIDSFAQPTCSVCVTFVPSTVRRVIAKGGTFGGSHRREYLAAIFSPGLTCGNRERARAGRSSATQDDQPASRPAPNEEARKCTAESKPGVTHATDASFAAGASHATPSLRTRIPQLLRSPELIKSPMKRPRGDGERGHRSAKVFSGPVGGHFYQGRGRGGGRQGREPLTAIGRACPSVATRHIVSK
jgi:hypothetical protein